jgi:hypothetical protein
MDAWRDGVFLYNTPQDLFLGMILREGTPTMTSHKRFLQALKKADPAQKETLLTLQAQLNKMLAAFQKLGVDPSLLESGYDEEIVRGEIEEMAKAAVQAFWKRKDVVAAVEETLRGR